MTTEQPQEHVERLLRVRVPPETVYTYWVEPDRLLQWQGVEAELDPKPGGIYRVNVTGRDITVGEFVEVDPGKRLVFTWGFERPGHPVPAGSTRVEVDFLLTGDITVVRVRHFGISKQEQLNTAYGWQGYLTRLGLVVAGRDPGPDPMVSPPPPPQTAPPAADAEAPAS